MSKKFSLIPVVAALISSASFAAVDTVTAKDIPVLKQEAQHTTASKRVTNLFTRQHYKRFSFNDALSEQIFDRYVESLDYSKSIFLQSDIARYEVNKKQFDDALMSGKLDFAYDLFNLSLQRRFERFQYAISLLDKEMTFDKEDAFYYDREEAEWAKDTAELNELWRQRVKYDALNLKLAGKDWPKTQELLTKRYKRAIKRLTQTTSEDVFQTVMHSFARSIEAHTSYLSPRNAERFKMEMNLSLEGIGAVLQGEDEYTVIRSLVPGGPAALSNQLGPEDKIVGVAQGDMKTVKRKGKGLVEIQKGGGAQELDARVFQGMTDGQLEMYFAQKGYAPEKAAEFIAENLEKCGADKVEICATEGHPIVYGDMEKITNP